MMVTRRCVLYLSKAANANARCRQCRHHTAQRLRSCAVTASIAPAGQAELRAWEVLPLRASKHAHVVTSWVCSTLILQHLLASLKSPDPISSHLQIPFLPKAKTAKSGFASLFAAYFFGKMQLGKEPAFSWQQEKCSFQVSIRFEFPQEK